MFNNSEIYPRVSGIRDKTEEGLCYSTFPICFHLGRRVKILTQYRVIHCKGGTVQLIWRNVTEGVTVQRCVVRVGALLELFMNPKVVYCRFQ